METVTGPLQRVPTESDSSSPSHSSHNNFPFNTSVSSSTYTSSDLAAKSTPGSTQYKKNSRLGELTNSKPFSLELETNGASALGHSVDDEPGRTLEDEKVHQSELSANQQDSVPVQASEILPISKSPSLTSVDAESDLERIGADIVVDEDTKAYPVRKKKRSKKKKKERKEAAKSAEGDGVSKDLLEDARPSPDTQGKKKESRYVFRESPPEPSGKEVLFSEESLSRDEPPPDKPLKSGKDEDISSPEQGRPSDPTDDHDPSKESPHETKTEEGPPISNSILQRSNAEGGPNKRPLLMNEREFDDNISLDILLALRTCVLGLRSLSSTGPINTTDYNFAMSYKISRTGTQKRFSVKDYSSRIFDRLRQQFFISNESYLKSWSNPNSLLAPSAGKSNSLFLKSSDKKFLLKTISKSESKSLRLMLPLYYQHLSDFHQSLLMRVVGHHKIMRKGKKIYCIIINNIFDTPLSLDEVYDLKGSKVGRETSENEKLKSTSRIWKDNDFMKQRRQILLPPQSRSALLDQLSRDCQFLEEHNIMDYSLLLGIHKFTEQEIEQLSKKTEIQKSPLSGRGSKVPSHVYFCEDVKQTKVRTSSFYTKRKTEERELVRRGTEADLLRSNVPTSPSSEKLGMFLSLPEVKEVYFIGIIDFLQKYSNKKRIAHIAKSLRYNKDDLSTVKPSHYSSRFIDFIGKVLVVGPPVFNEEKEPSKKAIS